MNGQKNEVIFDEKTGFYYATGNPLSIGWIKANMHAVELNKGLRNLAKELEAI